MRDAEAAFLLPLDTVESSAPVAKNSTRVISRLFNLSQKFSRHETEASPRFVSSIVAYPSVTVQ